MHSSHISDGGAVEFYRRAVAEGAGHLQAMVTLVSRITAKPWTRSLPYFTSHDWLCIGSSDAHIAVAHFPEGYFEVHYTTPQRQKAEVFRSPEMDETERRIDGLVVRSLMKDELKTSDKAAG